MSGRNVHRHHLPDTLDQHPPDLRRYRARLARLLPSLEQRADLAATGGWTVQATKAA